MIFSHLKRGFVLFLDPLIDHFIDRGYHPDTFTILGLVFNAIAGVLYGLGLFFEGGLVMLFGSITDTIDGQIARRTGGDSPGGALLDSTLDRYGEAAVLIGLIVHYAYIHWVVTVGITALALVGSFMVSYVRARAEALGYECKVGLMQRPERIIFLTAVSIFGVLLGTPDAHVAAAMWIMAVLTTLTSFERIMHIRRLSRHVVARSDSAEQRVHAGGDGKPQSRFLSRLHRSDTLRS